MGEYQALEHLVVLRQEQGDWARARVLAVELEELGGKLREGSEAPFARALLALSRRALAEEGAEAALDQAVGELRGADAKLRLAYALTRGARLDLERSDARRARARAEEARRAAMALGRPSEALRAGVTLVRACRALGEGAEAERLLGDLRRVAPAGVAEPARRELEDLLREEQKGGGRTAVAAGRTENRP